MLGHAAEDEQLRERLEHLLGSHLWLDAQPQALARVLVDHRHEPRDGGFAEATAGRLPTTSRTFDSFLDGRGRSSVAPWTLG